MFEQHYLKLSADLINLFLVIGFSLVIGLELRQNNLNEKSGTLFGTDRTHVFIGLLGYILFIISGENKYLYLAGGLAILLLLAIYYNYKIREKNQFGITTILVALITYTLAPLVYTKPLWLPVSIVTIVLIIVELKSFFWKLSSKFDENEFITLAKFLLISGVVLPLLSNKPISDLIPVSPFKIWASVVVISGISYISYLIKKFVFPEKGAFITGLLGGLYSSTATTIVLAKKSKYAPGNYNRIAAAIILATGMMFARVLILAFVFNKDAGKALMIPLLILALLSALIAWVIDIMDKKTTLTDDFKETEVKNPLEFKTALVFAVLFVFFSLLTEYVLKWYGHQGLHILSFVVGVTDIDPFLLSLFSGKYQISLQTLTQATLIAVTSNNLIKMIYALSLGNRMIWRPVLLGFGVIIIAGIGLIVF